MAFLKLYCRNRSAVLGLVILVSVLVLAATASIFYPDDPFRLAGKPAVTHSDAMWRRASPTARALHY